MLRWVLFVAMVVASRVARAEAGHPFELTWQAPAGCPSSADVEHEIARLIGETSRQRAKVRASAEVTRRDNDWRVQIRIQDGDHVSERSFEGSSCRAVTKVASLIIALAIEPNAGTTPEPPPLPPRERPEPPPSAPSRPAETPEAPMTSFLAVGPIAETRMLPSVGFGFEVGFGIRSPAISAELGAGALLAQSTDVASTAAGGRFSQITAGVRLCAHVASRSPELLACAAGLFDRLHAEGYGVTAPGSATALLASAAIGPRFELALSDALRLGLTLEATYAFSEANFRLDNIGDVHRTPRWGGSARAHLVWLF